HPDLPSFPTRLSSDLGLRIIVPSVLPASPSCKESSMQQNLWLPGLALGAILAASVAVAGDAVLTYPSTRRVDHVDDYHGTKVPRSEEHTSELQSLAYL